MTELYAARFYVKCDWKAGGMPKHRRNSSIHRLQRPALTREANPCKSRLGFPVSCRVCSTLGGETAYWLPSEMTNLSEDLELELERMLDWEDRGDWIHGQGKF